ncbi:MAG: PH domain-containing protein [Gammaproteobacteria bacterium]
MSRYFKSKVDWWYYALIVSVALVLGLTAYAVAAIEPAASSRDTATPALTFSVLAISVLPALGLPLWLLSNTGYTLDSTHLRVKSGPFSWTVPLADIRDVRPTRNPLSSPALSLDRLLIEHTGGSIMISPADKDAFLRELDSLRAQARGAVIQ